jgi:hypothetical protein
MYERIDVNDHLLVRGLNTRPESRLGVFPFAPLAADDRYELYEHLREVYNLLIFGEVVERPVV